MIYLSRIPPLHSQDATPVEEIQVVGSLKCSAIGMTWLVFELAEDADQFAGYLISPKQEAFGYFSLDHLDKFLPPYAELTFERYASGPMPLADVLHAERLSRGVYQQEVTRKTIAARACYLVAIYPILQAKQVFATIKKLLHENLDCDLSCYVHLLTATTGRITVIGDRPKEPLYSALLAAFEGTTFTTIDYNELMALFTRKLSQNEIGPWRSHHRQITLKRKNQ